MDNVQKKLLKDILICIESIENVQVWSILINHLPVLKNEAENLLEEN